MLGAMMRMPLTISSLIVHAAVYHGETPVVSIETDGSVNRSDWSIIERHARKLASALQQLGLPQGACCATIAWNNRRHLEIYFGVAGAGRICHTINPRLVPEQIGYIVNHAQDRVLFFDRTFLPLVAALAPKLPSVEHFVLMGPEDAEALAALPGLKFYDQLLAAGDQDIPWPELDENTASSLCYTSGTTGNSKGVLYSHRSTVLHSIGGNQPDGLALSARDSVLPVVPMFHVNAWGVPYIAAAVGAKLVLPGPKLDGESLLRLMQAEEVSIALGVPTIWMGLLAALRASGQTVPSLKRTVVGGSALPPSMYHAFHDEFGIEVIHAWGMTETSPLGVLNQPLNRHAGLDPEVRARQRLMQGRPPFGVELRIVDESGTVLAHDGKSQGHLQIRGHWIVERYFRAGETALDEGWFDTGDIATIDPDGYLVIRDRAKDIVKSGGEWISTVEIENIAIAMPGIANAAAIAAHHSKWGERPVVIAVKAEGSGLTEAEVLTWYETRLPKWQIPDRVIFVDSLPIGGTGKVVKSILRERFGLVLDAG